MLELVDVQLEELCVVEELVDSEEQDIELDGVLLDDCVEHDGVDDDERLDNVVQDDDVLLLDVVLEEHDGVDDEDGVLLDDDVL